MIVIRNLKIQKSLDSRALLSKVFMYLIVLCIVLDLGCMWKIVENSPVADLSVGKISGALCLIQIVFFSRIKITKKSVYRLSSILILLLLFATITQYNVERFLIGYVAVFVIYFIYATYLYNTNQVETFLRCFSNVMLAIALISLFFWLFGSIFNVLPGRTQTTYYWADRNRITYTYAHLYYENPVQNIGQRIVRNLGVFAEAPGYSAFIIYAILIEFGFKRANGSTEKNTWKLIVLTITLLSSSSTKGIIAFLLIYLLDYLFRNSKNPFDMTIKFLLGSLILIGVVFAIKIIMVDKLASGSGIIRMDDIQAELKAWLDYPIWGNGYENVNSIFKYSEVARDNGGLSMGIPVIMAYGGLSFLFLYLFSVFVAGQGSFFSKNKRIWIITSTLLLYNLTISNVGFTDLYILLLALAYATP